MEIPESLQKRMQTVTFRYAFTKSPNLANRCSSIKQQRCRPSCRWWMIQTDREQPKIEWNRLKQIGIKQASARVHFSDHIWGYQGLSWIIYGTLPPEEKCNWMLWRCPKACKNACKLWPSGMLLPNHQIWQTDATASNSNAADHLADGGWSEQTGNSRR